ncbi:Nitrogen regulation protein NR(I), GlnG (=NtrC) [Olavius algarvensis associated proteobacterium Delta 3]|nr:Nitrogen regulation protein NR(I), GlnG (=NtrC) [Olavius algarvensis associated proteobacterium Delta 3]
MASNDLKSDVTSLRERLEMYELIFDSIYNGAMVTDADGIITHFNKPYGQFLDLDPAAQIGKNCLEAIENSRMHIVAKTGKPEINQTHRMQGQDMVVQRIPIRKDGRVIAVFGQVMFKDVRDVRKLADRLSMLESKVKHYEEELLNLRSTRYTFESIIGTSRSTRQLKKEAFNAAANQFPVLVTGESGTGKELFAQAIHHSSPRKVYPFIRINCAAIPKDLLESELFGYEKGAFTGARGSGKPGKFELAHRGTIFLDEIGDLPLEMQPKLLRVVEDQEFERVGGTRVIQSDFRLISATNQNLDHMIAEGRFRKDLFYRLNVIPLNIPPLRERRQDILPIARHLLDQLKEEAAIAGIRIDPEAATFLKQHVWPGNVRELSNILERTLSTLEGDIIRLPDLPFYLQRESRHGNGKQQGTIKDVQAKAEKDAILTALKETGYNKTRAAGLLGIHRTLLYKKIKKYGLRLDG